jgi:plastocyanin
MADSPASSSPSSRPVKGTFPAKTTPVILDQQGCMYTPPVIALQVGQPLRMRNSDETLHNVHPRPTVNTGFNVGQPRKGMETDKKFDKPETFFPVSCDVHPWMRSYIAVFSHPFFTVTKDGRFLRDPERCSARASTRSRPSIPTLKIMTGKAVVKAGGRGHRRHHVHPQVGRSP